MGETILVTGGAGYIGSQACKFLAAAGHTPVCYDNFSTGRRNFVRFGPLFEGDIRDPDRLSAAFSEHRPDQVMHFAAKVEVEESVRNPTSYYDVNLGGTIELLKVCASFGVRQFVFSSTAAVYGTPSGSKVTVDMDTVPINPYGWSKLFAERVLSEGTREAQMGLTIFRYFNAAGADPDCELGGRFLTASHLLPRLITAAELGRAFYVFGEDYATPDGTCIRDYIHVADVASAHVAAAQRPATGGECRTFNLGVGRGHSVREMISAVERITGKAIDVHARPRRPGDSAELIAGGTDMALNDLGWVVKFPKIEDIILHSWRWYQNANSSG